MGIPKIIETSNGSEYVNKAFQQFDPNGISNKKQEFLIILKEKELWSVPKAPWKHSFKR